MDLSPYKRVETVMDMSITELPGNPGYKCRKSGRSVILTRVPRCCPALLRGRPPENRTIHSMNRSVLWCIRDNFLVLVVKGQLDLKKKTKMQTHAKLHEPVGILAEFT